jgi:hypothetical protein
MWDSDGLYMKGIIASGTFMPIPSTILVSSCAVYGAIGTAIELAV